MDKEEFQHASNEITEDDYPLYRIQSFVSRASRTFITAMWRKNGPDEPWITLSIPGGEIEFPVDL